MDFSRCVSHLFDIFSSVYCYKSLSPYWAYLSLSNEPKLLKQPAQGEKLAVKMTIFAENESSRSFSLRGSLTRVSAPDNQERME